MASILFPCHKKVKIKTIYLKVKLFYKVIQVDSAPEIKVFDVSQRRENTSVSGVKSIWTNFYDKDGFMIS